jgi:hypothetical protein
MHDRGVQMQIDGVDQPRPAPRVCRTPWAEPTAPTRMTQAAWLPL